VTIKIFSKGLPHVVPSDGTGTSRGRFGFLVFLLLDPLKLQLTETKRVTFA
jgi:hypothetical protein